MATVVVRNVGVRAKYTLAELLAKTKPSDFRLTQEDREWLDAPPRGKENI